MAAAMAVRRVAARTRTSRSSVVLAAICAVVARRAGHRELVFPLLSSNRFERHLVNYVGALAQASIATVEIGGRSFDELVRHAWTTVMEASRHGRYDTAKRDAMGELIEHERGLRINYAPLFNNHVPESWSALTAGSGFQPEEIDVALALTEQINGGSGHYGIGDGAGSLLPKPNGRLPPMLVTVVATSGARRMFRPFPQ